MQNQAHNATMHALCRSGARCMRHSGQKDKNPHGRLQNNQTIKAYQNICVLHWVWIRPQ